MFSLKNKKTINTVQVKKSEALWMVASRKHTYIILTPLNPTFI